MSAYKFVHQLGLEDDPGFKDRINEIKRNRDDLLDPEDPSNFKSPEQLTKLVTDNDPLTVMQALKHPGITSKHLSLVTNHPDSNVLHAVIRHPMINADHLDQIYANTNNADLKDTVLEHDETSSNTFDRAIPKSNDEMISRRAFSAMVSPTLRFKPDEAGKLRTVSSFADVTPEQLHRLAQIRPEQISVPDFASDADKKRVRQQTILRRHKDLADNPQLSSETIDYMIKSPNVDKRVKTKLVLHRNASKEARAFVSKSSSQ